MKTILVIAFIIGAAYIILKEKKCTKDVDYSRDSL
ncbi:hypothetical protein PDPUS_2_00779 [Photobacterium damselae subsp. piscicida]|uniref:Uncharacterized protein n=2 Tax=Photobacterium damselae TaxID=38293 RepID=A0A2X1XMG7_PHODM|nr:hypothetical protein EQ875_01270 [Photobacterium damselae subsp. damselae]BAX55365.1 hypothetical protein PDPUS_2_00779 [Photobacterium damselae subsp. piscicida]SPY30060.1 Uncharacterised protein [Photobacterium damselae]SPY44698.1 Uncharacterised protein [Photobacterium damselae]SUB90197.1 Uncharacterised protein [Photobacterium damselae]